MAMNMQQYTDYLATQCACTCHRVAGVSHVAPCCNKPAVDAAYEKQMDMLGEFVEEHPIGGRVFLRD